MHKLVVYTMQVLLGMFFNKKINCMIKIPQRAGGFFLQKIIVKCEK
jgi:hypothetical protein